MRRVTNGSHAVRAACCLIWRASVDDHLRAGGRERLQKRRECCNLPDDLDIDEKDLARCRNESTVDRGCPSQNVHLRHRALWSSPTVSVKYLRTREQAF